ncbi:MAG: DUF1992 domain-containing protein [Chloroflexota bacterium]
MSFDKIIEAAIKEAMERGEFDDLPGKGKRIDLTAYFDAPEDVRVAQSLLKNAGLAPVEIEYLQHIAALEEKLASAPDEEKRKPIRKELEQKRLAFNLLMERSKRQVKR